VFKGGLYPTKTLYALFYSYFTAKKQFHFKFADSRHGDINRFKTHFKPPKLKRLAWKNVHNASPQSKKDPPFAGHLNATLR
jgi:hypothetical protein